MGWSSGSSLFSDIIIALNEKDLEEDVRKKVYESLIPSFEEMDCDTLEECMGEDDAFDEAYKELHPTYFEDDKDEEERLLDEE